ncbi:hypothetical protein [Bacillus sp. 1P06AnD]|uniref:hypothetical protein n=1 Tax=Bacillus sp. 1P06AnD TaxID=3132208 RepID=UPI0039A2E51B
MKRIIVLIMLLLLMGCSNSGTASTKEKNFFKTSSELKEEIRNLKKENESLRQKNSHLSSTYKHCLPPEDLKAVINKTYTAILAMQNKEYTLLKTVLHPNLSIDVKAHAIISTSTGYRQTMMFNENTADSFKLEFNSPFYNSKDKNMIIVPFSKTDYTLQQRVEFELTFKRLNNTWLLYTFLTN